MKIHAIRYFNTLNKDSNLNKSCPATPVLKSTLNCDTISFRGARHEALRAEIAELDEQIEAKGETVEKLESILSEIEDSNRDILSSREDELSALRDIESTHEQTKSNLNDEISTKDELIDEINRANDDLRTVLQQQEQEATNVTAENERLQREIEDAPSKHQAKFKADLETQAVEMEKAHNSEMDELDRKIEESIRKPDPLKRAINIPKPDGFGRIVGYQEQKELLIKHFGNAVALERLGKPTEVPNGVLLFGPKGCGKSTFTKAFAGQFNCPVVQIPISQDPQIAMQNLREATTSAQANFEKTGQRTILFIDGFETFAPKNSRITGALKGFMDDVSSKYHCTLFATTDSPESIDDILLRDKRFDVKVGIPPANQQDAIEVLKHYGKGVADESVRFYELADEIVKCQPDAAFSNERIKTIFSGFKTSHTAHADLIQAIRRIGPDIAKDALELFKKQLEHVKHL